MSQIILPPGLPARLNKTWFKDCYQQALLFYEKDHCLTQSDRLELAEIYRDIASVKKRNGWLSFSTVVLMPFILRYRNTGSIWGTQISRSFFFGMLTYVIVSCRTGHRELQKKIDQLSQNVNPYDDEEDYGSKEKRQVEILKILSSGPTMEWSNYFYRTYSNPESTFGDPQLHLQKFIEATNGLRSADATANKLATATSQSYSSWDKIRANSSNEGN